MFYSKCRKVLPVHFAFAANLARAVRGIRLYMGLNSIVRRTSIIIAPYRGCAVCQLIYFLRGFITQNSFLRQKYCAKISRCADYQIANYRGPNRIKSMYRCEITNNALDVCERTVSQPKPDWKLVWYTTPGTVGHPSILLSWPETRVRGKWCTETIWRLWDTLLLPLASSPTRFVGKSKSARWANEDIGDYALPNNLHNNDRFLEHMPFAASLWGHTRGGNRRGVIHETSQYSSVTSGGRG